MMHTQTCVLPDGRRIRYGLQKRSRDVYWLVRFRGPDGRRVERSTKEESLKRAEDAACVVIREEYEPSETPPPQMTWEEARGTLRRLMVANNCRKTTIDHYVANLSGVQKIYPKTKGPAEITRQHAIDYKFKRLDNGIAPITVASNLNILSTIWAKWWRHFLPSNPWADIDWPKVDKKKPALVEQDQYAAFVNWIEERYGPWRLPILFLEAKSYLGCRIYELAALVPEQLKDGRVCFQADVSKGRKPRECRIPPELYQELKVGSGPEYVFQQFHEELRAIYRRQGKTQYVTLLHGFTARRLKNWMQDHLIQFRKEHPEIKRFKLHSLRATAISQVRQAGVSPEKASIYFGVNVQTMAKHYEAVDETAIADEVGDARQKVWRKCGENEKADAG